MSRNSKDRDIWDARGEIFVCSGVYESGKHREHGPVVEHQPIETVLDISPTLKRNFRAVVRDLVASSVEGGDISDSTRSALEEFAKESLAKRRIPPASLS